MQLIHLLQFFLTINRSSVNWIWERLRAFGPYLLIELLIPGGTLVALLLWLSQNGRFETRRAIPPPATRSQASSILRAMLGHATLPLARRA